MSIPYKCPCCGNSSSWIKVAEQNKGFSVGKAAVGGALLGPIGLAGGALGKKKTTMFCRNCNFKQEYSGSQESAPVQVPTQPLTKNTSIGCSIIFILVGLAAIIIPLVNDWWFPFILVCAIFGVFLVLGGVLSWGKT